MSLNEGQLDTTDLSVFETSGKIPPGIYTLTLFVNQQDRGQHTLVFKEDGKGGVMPELTPDFLYQQGVNTDVLPAFSGLPKNKPINSLSELIPDAQIKFDFSQPRLEISILSPSAGLYTEARVSVAVLSRLTEMSNFMGSLH